MIVDLTGIKKKINEIYHPLFQKSNTYKYNVLWGGAGSGKSYSIGEKIVHRIITERDHVILVVRKSYTEHRNTTYAELKKVIKSFGLLEHTDFISNPLEIRFPEFNSKIIFLGVDDSEKLKGLSEVSSVWIDEITALESSDFAEIEDRLRHPTHLNQIYITFNPVSEHHWIKARFFDTEDERALIIKSTYKDNKYCTPDYIQQREMQRITDPRRYRIYTLGEWGVMDRDNLYYHRFDDVTHVAKHEFDLDRNLGVMISLDFNVTPHITALVVQVDDIEQIVYIQDELSLPSPRNNTEDLAKACLARVEWYEDLITVYGDATGDSRNALVREGVNHYTIFKSVLENAGKQVRISIDNVNPSLSTRQIFVNNFLAGVHKYKIVISPRCKNLIADLLNQKMTMENGKVGISKQKVRNKLTGMSYEKYGHSGDAFSYFLVRHFSTMYNKLKYGSNITRIITTKVPTSNNFY